MKPANFPARKNERRYRAMLRLIDQPSHLCGQPQALRLAIADALQLRLDHNARNVRSKKSRGQLRPHRAA